MNETVQPNTGQKPTTPPVIGQKTSARPKMTDAEARALLTASNLQAPQKTKSPSKLMVYLIIVIIFIIAGAIFFYVTDRSNNTSSGGTGNGILPNPTNNPLNNNGSIKSQEQYCSNPINAGLVC